MLQQLPELEGEPGAPEALAAGVRRQKEAHRGAVGPTGPRGLTVARGTMPARSFWLMKISDTAGSVVALRGYSTCQAMGCVPDRLLKLAISKFICTTSLNKLLLLEKEQRRVTLSGPWSVEGPFSPSPATAVPRV